MKAATIAGLSRRRNSQEVCRGESTGQTSPPFALITAVFSLWNKRELRIGRDANIPLIWFMLNNRWPSRFKHYGKNLTPPFTEFLVLHKNC